MLKDKKIPLKRVKGIGRRQGRGCSCSGGVSKDCTRKRVIVKVSLKVSLAEGTDRGAEAPTWECLAPLMKSDAVPDASELGGEGQEKTRAER